MPGELIHVDIKKIAGIPDAGGWRIRGRGCKGDGAKRRRAGYRCTHTGLDDRKRIAYSETLDDERGATAAGFWLRAAQWWLQAIGTKPERVIADNGGCSTIRGSGTRRGRTPAGR